jgi:hypothetical protein
MKSGGFVAHRGYGWSEPGLAGGTGHSPDPFRNGVITRKGIPESDEQWAPPRVRAVVETRFVVLSEAAVACTGVWSLPLVNGCHRRPTSGEESVREGSHVARYRFCVTGGTDR